MKYLNFLLVLALFFISCSKSKQLNDYIEIVESADKMIFYTKEADTFAITRNVDSSEHLQNLKNILKRNIEPENQKEFTVKYKIEIYRQEREVGVLLISDTKEEPFVNFTSDKLGFGFKLTYGIGMSL